MFKNQRGWYMRTMKKHSFIMFGLPFMTMLFGATYMLSFFTQVRYERHDAHVTAMTEEEGLKLARGRRKVNLKDEYYRLQNLDIDNWEQKRPERKDGAEEPKWSRTW